MSAGGKVYFLAPKACQQVSESRRMISAAAASVAPGRAAVLGAGACEEIPLAELAARFEQVVLCDVNAEAMQQGLAAAKLSPDQWDKVSLRTVDLTGITESLLAEIQTKLAECSEPIAAIEHIAAGLQQAQPQPMPLDGRFDLIVASCLLSQLHFGLTHGAEALFVARFPDQQPLWRASPHWSDALARLARRMEAKFLDSALALLAEGGQIYVSESVQMCYLQWHPSGQWQTEGTFRMLQSRDLADYFDARFEIISRGRWDWVVWPPTKPGEIGRLFDVQAVVLRAGRA